jgi:hypothetical protein
MNFVVMDELTYTNMNCLQTSHPYTTDDYTITADFELFILIIIIFLVLLELCLFLIHLKIYLKAIH